MAAKLDDSLLPAALTFAICLRKHFDEYGLDERQSNKESVQEHLYVKTSIEKIYVVDKQAPDRG